MSKRLFILSPAHCGGQRAKLIYNDQAQFDLARQVRTKEGAPLGEVFSFLSGLYFRGKLAYAQAFAKPHPCDQTVLVITTNRGLLPVETKVRLPDLRAMANGDIDQRDSSYRRPLATHAQALAAQLGRRDQVVLLGSIATGKYVDGLLEAFGSRLLFPEEFVGRGDMSRGGLMLRCVDQMKELTYVPIHGAVRNGTRPPKLERSIKATR